MSVNKLQFLDAALYSMICTGAPMEEAALKGLHEIIGDIALEAMNDRRRKEIEYQKAEQEMQEMLQRMKFGGLQ